MLDKTRLTKEWIDSIPKTINENGCWIPLDNKPSTVGYVMIMIEGNVFSLSRLSMCIIYNVDYGNKKIVARHSKGCDRACFFYDHLKPGTDSDNAKDSVRDGTHRQAQKKVCPKCGGEYKTKIIQGGWSKGQIYRYCLTCRSIGDLGRKR